MACIYLKISKYIAAYYRNRDADNRLSVWEPIVLADILHENIILTEGLHAIQTEGQGTRLCYSQRCFGNILRGRNPYTGKPVFKRDPSQWPDVNEFCAIEGRQMSKHEDVFDYLCIKIPKEIYTGKRVVLTTPSFSLDFKSAKLLEGLLRKEFYHVFADWCIQDREFCNKNGIRRSRSVTIEMFLTQYEIPVTATDEHEKESLRRMANRWFDRAGVLPNDRVNFADPFFRHISDDEKRKRDSADNLRIKM